MGNGSSSSSSRPLKEPLVPHNSDKKKDNQHVVSSNYDTIRPVLPRPLNFQHSALLDPLGNLSQDLQDTLNEIFASRSSGLVMTRAQLSSLIAQCYPNLKNDDDYSARADFILEKYGTLFGDFKRYLQHVVQSSQPQEDWSNVSGDKILEPPKKYILSQEQLPHDKKIASPKVVDNDNEKVEDKDEDKVKEIEQHENVDIDVHESLYTNASQNNSNESNRREMRKYTLVSIEEEKETIDLTLDIIDIPDDEIILNKAQFFMFYRKACIDRPIMTRLELVALGYDQFKSSGLFDKSKQLDLLSYKVQKMHTLYEIHGEEKNRIQLAATPAVCAKSIKTFIATHPEPMDRNNAQNPFRRRKPIKCNACCWCFCPCLVLFAKCCCD